MPLPIFLWSIQQLDSQWLCQMLTEHTFPNHQITICFHTKKISGVVSDLQTIQQNITSDFPNILIRSKNICIGRLDRVIGSTNIRTLWNLPFLTTTFEIFLSHSSKTSVVPNYPDAYSRFPKTFLNTKSTSVFGDFKRFLGKRKIIITHYISIFIEDLRIIQLKWQRFFNTPQKGNFPKNGILEIYYVPGQYHLSSKGQTRLSFTGLDFTPDS